MPLTIPSNRACKPTTTRRFNDDDNANLQTQAEKSKKQPIIFEDSSSESDVPDPIAPPKKIPRQKSIECCRCSDLASSRSIRGADLHHRLIQQSICWWSHRNSIDRSWFKPTVNSPLWWSSSSDSYVSDTIVSLSKYPAYVADATRSPVGTSTEKHSGLMLGIC